MDPASVTAVIHGSNSSSSLASLDYQQNARHCPSTLVSLAQQCEGNRNESTSSRETSQSFQGIGELNEEDPVNVVISIREADILERDGGKNEIAFGNATTVELVSIQNLPNHSTSHYNSAERRTSVSSSTSSATLPPGPLLEFLEENDEPGMTISSETEDIFTLDTFHALVQSRIRQCGGHNKCIPRALIIAKVTSRDKECTQKLTSHFYEATNFLNVLFRIKGERVLHRYHRYSAILPRNPLTNTLIVGEVRFYSIDYDNILPLLAVSADSPFVPFLLAPNSYPIPPKYIAKFIGTDYHFAYSPEFRDLFVSATMDVIPENDNEKDGDMLVKINQGLSNSESPLRRAAPRQTRVLSSRTEDDRVDIFPCLRSCFPASRTESPVSCPRATVLGALGALYFVLCALVVYESVNSLLDTKGSSGKSKDAFAFLSTYWYGVFIPIVSFGFDQALSIVYSRPPGAACFAVKLVLYLAYYILPILSFCNFMSGVPAAIWLRFLPLVTLPLMYLALSVSLWFRNAQTMELM